MKVVSTRELTFFVTSTLRDFQHLVQVVSSKKFLTALEEPRHDWKSLKNTKVDVKNLKVLDKKLNTLITQTETKKLFARRNLIGKSSTNGNGAVRWNNSISGKFKKSGKPSAVRR